MNGLHLEGRRLYWKSVSRRRRLWVRSTLVLDSQYVCVNSCSTLYQYYWLNVLQVDPARDLLYRIDQCPAAMSCSRGACCSLMPPGRAPQVALDAVAACNLQHFLRWKAAGAMLLGIASRGECALGNWLLAALACELARHHTCRAAPFDLLHW